MRVAVSGNPEPATRSCTWNSEPGAGSRTWEPGTRYAFPYLGTQNPLRVPVPGNLEPATRSHIWEPGIRGGFPYVGTQIPGRVSGCQRSHSRQCRSIGTRTNLILCFLALFQYTEIWLCLCSLFWVKALWVPGSQVRVLAPGSEFLGTGTRSEFLGTGTHFGFQGTEICSGFQGTVICFRFPGTGICPGSQVWEPVPHSGFAGTGIRAGLLILDYDNPWNISKSNVLHMPHPE